MNRRKFLAAGSAGTALHLVPGLAQAMSLKADETGYKALVVVFLFGGNDAHNTVVPYQSAEYNAYASARGGPASNNGLALPYENLQPLVPPGGTAANAALALHPAMPRLAQLYNAGRMAVIANAGPLLDETSLAQYRTAGFPLPPQLFSHSDMQMHWQTMLPDEPALSGWGGRMADVFRQSSAGRVPVVIPVGNGGIFTKGFTTQPYSVRSMRYSNGAIDPGSTIAATPSAAISWNWTGSLPQQVFERNLLDARGNLLEQQHAKVARASIEVGAYVRDAMYTVTTNPTTYTLRFPVPGTWPVGNPLAAQLHSVAAMIAARSTLATSRQVFFVALGGFDNHGDQFGSVSGGKSLLSGKHYQLLAWVDEALRTFYDATVAMGVASQVTTMTMSDFGRTILSNGQGSDHGWGGHYFALGGAVKGGRVYGCAQAGAPVTEFFPMPSQLAAAQLDVGQGRLLPTLSSDAYAATLARWFGADASEVVQIFPNLPRFNIQQFDLMV